MTWEERIRNSDAGKLMPERAEEVIAAVKKREKDKEAVTMLRNEYA